jgi:pimeloyl-ACP methyl ester carboxylesterase
MTTTVFVHGAGLSRSCWHYQTKFFPNSVAVDLPGHGESDGPAYSSISDYARWLGEDMRRVGPEPVTLVGHSMGSLIALETAARNPDMVARLVLISTSASMRVNRELLDAAAARDPAAAAMVIKWTLPRDSGYARPKKWVLAISEDFMNTAASGVMANDLTACDDYTEAVAMAGRVRCPVLLLLGENDKMTPPAAAQPLAAALADARIVVIEKVGHMLPLEKPAEVNETISLFLGVD